MVIRSSCRNYNKNPAKGSHRLSSSSSLSVSDDDVRCSTAWLGRSGGVLRLERHEVTACLDDGGQAGVERGLAATDRGLDRVVTTAAVTSSRSVSTGRSTSVLLIHHITNCRLSQTTTNRKIKRCNNNIHRS